jgi:hypothetical protein
LRIGRGEEDAAGANPVAGQLQEWKYSPMPHLSSIEQTFMTAASLATRSFRFERPKSGVLIH